MKKKKPNASIKTTELKSIEYPIIYSYIYERETEDIKRLSEEFKNVTIKNPPEHSNPKVILGYKIEGEKAVPIFSNPNEEIAAQSEEIAAPMQKISKQTIEQRPLLIELFLEELKDIYWGEKHLTKALPRIQKAVTSKELNKVLSQHVEIKKIQIDRIEQAFELLDQKALGRRCEAINGLTLEAEEIIEDTDVGTITRDIALIMALQKIEHYEIATYGSMVQLAKTIGINEVSDLMNQTLSEEQETNQLLTKISEERILEKHQESYS